MPMKVKTILVSQPEPKIENSPYSKLIEKENEHFYRNAEEILRSAPKPYKSTYKMIIEKRLIRYVLKI